ncbi:MAG: TIGR02147 family protein [Bdellovibrionaceae bacterium]|nr:TIGR02147 family protein [Pseudobdellovibrionaceae bacterium]
MKKCFEFDAYKDYLRHVEEAWAPLQKGFRTKLAKGLGIQSAYVSKVLNGDAQLSLEQGLRLCDFLKLDEGERRYLLCLIEFARAGTKELKQFFGELLADLREKHLNLTQNVGQVQSLTPEAQTIYYSHWFYSAIHAAVSIPGLQSVDNLAQALRMDRKKIKDAIFSSYSAEFLNNTAENCGREKRNFTSTGLRPIFSSITPTGGFARSSPWTITTKKTSTIPQFRAYRRKTS